MAPAGSYESLMAALKAGCNSVYFGVEQLNMRARSSNNFTIEDLKRIAEIGKEHDVKTYLTLNTVLYILYPFSSLDCTTTFFSSSLQLFKYSANFLVEYIFLYFEGLPLFLKSLGSLRFTIIFIIS